MNAASPRAQQTYDIKKDSRKTKQPLIVGIIADFSGSSHLKSKEIGSRESINVNKDNFSDVMKQYSPSVSSKVKNHLDENADSLTVNLVFESIKDFEPMSIIQQTPQLKLLQQQKLIISDLLESSEQSSEFKSELELALSKSNMAKNT